MKPVRAWAATENDEYFANSVREFESTVEVIINLEKGNQKDWPYNEYNVVPVVIIPAAAFDALVEAAKDMKEVLEEICSWEEQPHGELAIKKAKAALKGVEE